MLAGIFGSSFWAALLLNSLHIAGTSASSSSSAPCVSFTAAVVFFCKAEANSCNIYTQRQTALHDKLCHGVGYDTRSHRHRHRHRLCHQTWPPRKMRVHRDCLAVCLPACLSVCFSVLSHCDCQGLRVGKLFCFSQLTAKTKAIKTGIYLAVKNLLHGAKTAKETDRQTGRKTGSQADRQTGKQTDEQTDRQIERK